MKPFIILAAFVILVASRLWRLRLEHVLDDGSHGSLASKIGILKGSDSKTYVLVEDDVAPIVFTAQVSVNSVTLAYTSHSGTQYGLVTETAQYGSIVVINSHYKPEKFQTVNEINHVYIGHFSQPYPYYFTFCNNSLYVYQKPNLCQGIFRIAVDEEPLIQ